MKKLLLLVIISVCTQLHAQIVNIPDPVFKDRIIDNGVDTNNDDEIQYSEAEAVTDELNVVGILNGNNISDLTGIEAFVNITEFKCSVNSISTINLNQNTALIRLECWENPLTSLNLTQCTAIEFIDAQLTELTGLDVSNNVNLATLKISEGQLTTLDLTHNTNLESISLYNNASLNFLDIRSGNNTNINAFGSILNSNLVCIFVDDAAYMESNFGNNIDPTSHFVETQAECDALGVNDNVFEKIQIYPNPVNDRLYIKSSPEFGIQNSELVITDLLGKTVYSTTLIKNSAEIRLSNLKQGIYFLTFYKNSQKLLTKKIIKL